MPIIIMDIDAWTGAAVETLRFATSSFVTSGADVPANTPYLGRILDAGMMASTAFASGSIGRPSVSLGSLVLNNQNGSLDKLFDYGFDGRAFTIREIDDKNSPVTSGRLIAKGICAGIDATDAWKSIRIRLRDQLAAIQKPLLTTRYLGTSIGPDSGAEGDDGQKDQIKPVGFGRNVNVPLLLVNNSDLIYQATSNGFDSILVYDGAVPLSFFGDYPTLAALRSATIGTGATQNYATCKALGLVRTDDKPVFTLTGDVVEGATTAARSAAQVALRLLTLGGVATSALDLASFATLDALASYEVGIYVTGEENIDELVGQVLDSVGAALIPNGAGVLACVLFRPPTGPSVASYTMRDMKGSGGSIRLVSGMTDEGDGVPAYSVTLEWGRIWQVMNESDLDRANITPERKTVLTKATQTASSNTAAGDVIKIAHPLAAQISYTTLLVDRSSADAEVTRRFLMHSVRRDRLSITIDSWKAVPIGSDVTITLPRFGYSNGKLFRVVGRSNDHTKREVTLELWG